MPPALFAQHDRVTPPSIDSRLENDSIVLPTSTSALHMATNYLRTTSSYFVVGDFTKVRKPR